LENAAQARFIDTLAYFPSAKIDEAVRDILHSTEADYLAHTCARFLAGRGADDEIRKYVEKRLPGAGKEKRRELSRLLDRLGWTPLHLAAETYENGKLNALIQAGADVNARAANGQTPLHVAADHGSYGGIRILLKNGGNPNLKDDKGQTPVQLASLRENPAAPVKHPARSNLHGRRQTSQAIPSARRSDDPTRFGQLGRCNRARFARRAMPPPNA
jgi:hypothetical protein